MSEKVKKEVEQFERILLEEGGLMSGTAKEVNICGRLISLGDKVKVKYTGRGGMAGGTIEGEITELWSMKLDNYLQGRVSSGWCFHDNDEIVEYTPRENL